MSEQVEVPDHLDADRLLAAGKTPPSARIPLSRDRITVAAIAFIDDQGLPGLTMRRVGELLEVEAMSLYRYMPSKERLLDAVAAMTIGELSRDEAVSRVPVDGWQDFLHQLAHGIRRVALRHPNVFPLVASRPSQPSWLRPPFRSVDWVEAFLSGMVAEGFSDDSAIASYRAFSGFLLGYLLLEASALGTGAGPFDTLAGGSAYAEPLARYPVVRRLQAGLTEDRAAADFEEALEALLVHISGLLVKNADCS